jgi:hypothetical protein
MSQEQEFRDLLATRPEDVTARLIRTADDVQKLSMFCEADVATALARGLKDYLSTLDMHWPGGRHFQFKEVFISVASFEVPAKFPSASVFGETEGEFEDTQMSPVTVQVNEHQDGRFIRIVSQFTKTLELTVWATDTAERIALCSMVENALDPVDFMCGLRLELPFYYNARAEYLTERSEFLEDEQDAQQRRRKAKYYITASCPKIVPVGSLPLARPRVSVSANSAS